MNEIENTKEEINYKKIESNRNNNKNKLIENNTNENPISIEILKTKESLLETQTTKTSNIQFKKTEQLEIKNEENQKIENKEIEENLRNISQEDSNSSSFSSNEINQLPIFCANPTAKPISIFALVFKNLSICDRALVAIAILFTLASGVGTPLFSLLIGQAISSFETFEPFNNLQNQKFLPQNQKNKNLQKFQNFINEMLTKFLLIGSGLFISTFISGFLWTYTGFKNTANIKTQFFKNLMNQSQAWFDKQNPYAIPSKANLKLKTIEAALSERPQNALFSLAAFAAGISIAFAVSWKLAFVLVSVAPLIALIMHFIAKAIRRDAQQTAKLQYEAFGYAEEILNKIRTVFAFANFEFEIHKFNLLINQAKNSAISAGKKSAIGNGALMLFYFCSYAIAIGYGSLLIYEQQKNKADKDPLSGGDVLTTILCVLVSGISLGYLLPHLKAIWEARVSAADLFELRKQKNENEENENADTKRFGIFNSPVQLNGLKNVGNVCDFDKDNCFINKSENEKENKKSVGDYKKNCSKEENEKDLQKNKEIRIKINENNSNYKNNNSLKNNNNNINNDNNINIIKKNLHSEIIKNKIKQQETINKGKIEFKNIRFSYADNPKHKILKNISLIFEPQKKTAIVGESGAGKSTLIHLIERLYEPDSGEILIDGVNIKEFDLRALRANINYVQQEPVLFNRSIKENLIFGRKNFDEKALNQACDKALLSGFIAELKDKLEFRVGFRGKNLSSAERQKIAIARALLFNPKIFIFDEPTSIFDVGLEKQILRLLDDIGKNSTLIVISHRLNTIVNFDRIYVMRKGEIVEFGTHKELMEKEGYYAQLFKQKSLIKKKKSYFADFNENDENKDNKIFNTNTKNDTKNNKSINENYKADENRIILLDKFIEKNEKENENEPINYKKNENEIEDEIEIEMENQSKEEQIRKDDGEINSKNSSISKIQFIVNSFNNDVNFTSELDQVPHLEQIYSADTLPKFERINTTKIIKDLKIISKNLEKENKNKIKNFLVDKKESEKSKTKKIKISKFIFNIKIPIILACINACCNGFIFPFFGMLLANSVDSLTAKGNPEKIKSEGFFYAMMFLLMAFLASTVIAAHNFFIIKISENFSANLTLELFKFYLKMDCAFFDEVENTPGALAQKMVSYPSKAKFYLVSLIFFVLPFAVGFLVRIALGMRFDWRLTLIAFSATPLLFAASALQNKLKRSLLLEDELLDKEANILLAEAVLNSKAVFSFNFQDELVEIYSELIKKSGKNLLKKCVISGAFSGFSQIVLYVYYSVLLYVGGLFMLEGSLTFGKMLRAVFSLLFAASGLALSQQYIGEMHKGKHAYRKALELMQTKSQMNPFAEEEEKGEKLINKKKDAENIQGKIEFKNVCFAYSSQPEKIVLRNISFIVQPGEKVAFTGFAASGKTTIMRLIERFYDCTSGEIFIDNVNIKEYKLISLRKQIALVISESIIFKRSISENIEYGKIGSLPDEINRAAEAANISALLRQSRKSERNDEHYSKGQKQRISFARALLKNPRIFLLDKATVGLDRISALEMQKAIFAYTPNSTCLVVSHRVSILERCDFIYFMDNGEIVEQGTHEDLIARKGFYFNLYKK